MDPFCCCPDFAPEPLEELPPFDELALFSFDPELALELVLLDGLFVLLGLPFGLGEAPALCEGLVDLLVG